MYTGHHLHAVSVQLHHSDTFCLHATIIPNASQLCKHLEITLIKPLWHSSSRNSLLSAAMEVLLFLCVFFEAAVKPVQVVFHPSCDSSPIILLVLKFSAALLCPGTLILRYYHSSSSFFWYSVASLLNGGVYKLASCKLRLM